MRLQSTGRPDLVTKMLLLQLPPYLLGLYLGMKYFGLPGSALAFTVRCMVDYLLLTWAAGRDFRALPLLAFNFMLLVLAACLADIWTIGQWQWWASATVIGLVMLAVAWRTLPPEARGLLLDRLGSLRRGSSTSP